MPSVPFTFKWPSSTPSSVLVTGTFDSWSQSVRLERSDSGFARTVDLPVSGSAVYYKFVVDGQWQTDPAAPLEKDQHNNYNNVLSASAIAAIMSSSPDKLPADPAVTVDPIPATDAPANPIKSTPGDVLPDISTLPASHAATLSKDDYDGGDKWAADAIAAIEAKSVPEPEPEFSVAPIPASATNAPTLATAAADAHVTLGQEEYTNTKDELAEHMLRQSAPAAAPAPEDTFSVSPIPASVGNAPDHVAASSIQDTVTLDKESYENGSDPLAHQTLAGAANETVSVSPLPAADANEPSAHLSSVHDKVTTSKQDYENATADDAQGFAPKPKEDPTPESEEPVLSVAPIPASLSNAPPAATEDVDGQATKDITLGKEDYETPKDDYASATLAQAAVKAPADAAPAVIPADEPTQQAVLPAAIQSATPDSTTAELAAKVPIEPRSETAKADAPEAATETPPAPAADKEDAVEETAATTTTATETAATEAAATEAATTETVSAAPAAASDPVPVVNSVAPESTTAALAATVPVEPSAVSPGTTTTVSAETASKAADQPSPLPKSESPTEADKDKKKKRRSIAGWFKDFKGHLLSK